MTNINTLNRTEGAIDGSTGSDELDVKAILSQLRLHKWLLFGCLSLGLILGILSYLGADRTYKSATTLMLNIEGEAAQAQATELVQTLTRGRSEALAPALAIANSTALLERVVDELRLSEDDEFNPLLRDPTLRKQVRGFVSNTLKDLFAFVTGQETEEKRERTPEEQLALERRLAVAVLDNRVRISDLQDDLQLRIEVTTQDPDKSARIADMMAVKLNEFMKSSKVGALNSAQTWIENEAARVEGSLAEIGDEINEQISAGSVLPDSTTLGENAERLVSGELILAANKRRIAALTRLGEVIARIEGGGDAQAAFAVLPSTDRSELMSDYLDIFRWEARDEPPAPAELLAARRLVERDLENQGRATTRQEREILPIRAYTRSLSTAQNRYTQLKTAYDANTELLKALRVRLAELQIEKAGEVERLTVLEDAKPPFSHATPSLVRSLALGGMLGLMLGLSWVFWKFFTRDGFRSLEDVERVFGADTIAVVPDFDTGLSKQFAWSFLPNEVREAYRRIYAAFFVIREDDGEPRSLMVTSSSPNEGKTTTSLYIAAAAAEEGRRVLVIDLDYRKRSLSTYLDVRHPEGHGTFTVFRDEVELDKAVVPYGFENGGHEGTFDVLTSGGRRGRGRAGSGDDKGPQTARETLSMPDVRRLLEKAKDYRYEVIIVDVPPILAVQDAGMIGQLVDFVLNVVSTKDLRKKAGERAAKEWARAKVAVSGLVVRGSKTDLYEYYGYDYYSYDYANKSDSRKRRPSQRRRKRRQAAGRYQAKASRE